MVLLSDTGLPMRTVNALKKKKILTDDDLLRREPRVYKDYRTVKGIRECKEGTCNAVGATLTYLDARNNNGKRYLVMRAKSLDGEKIGILIFSRLYLYKQMYALLGHNVVITGKVTVDDTYGYSMNEPDEIVEANSFQPGIVPVYSKVKGISDAGYKALVDQFLPGVHEPFEWELMERTKVMDYRTALQCIHHPETPNDIRRGHGRLIINDLLYFSVGLQIGNHLPAESPIRFNQMNLYQTFVSGLPFTLTEDQQKALQSIHNTCTSGRRLDMLLYGDVGSGKTAVAIGAMMMAVASGYQAVLMAPRGVLASQHYRSCRSMTGLPEDKIVFLHSGMKAAERRNCLRRIADGSASIIVGTHSCVSEAVRYGHLGLVVIDEEHLFGVEQKKGIVQKAASGVHVLSMSATPIPRTLAGTVYGKSRTIMQLKSRPAGRLPIKTAIVANREQVFPFLYHQIQKGRQCYIVCPAIEEGDDADMASVTAMEKEYGSWFKGKGVSCAAVTGKTDKAEAEKIMKSFTQGSISVLITTTVVEVGVDVPNASVIVIEQADRFGLASLHQLRGRVGRGTYQSYCILRSNDTENERLNTIRSTTDGLTIAEADLKFRGSGELFGDRQSGDNRFMDLMLTYPAMFTQLEPVADWCVTNRFGGGLMELYKNREAG